MDFSPAEIVAGFMVSTVGGGFFIYGKKQHRWPQLVAGLVMMIGPCCCGGAAATWVLGAVSTLGVWLALRVGW